MRSRFFHCSSVLFLSICFYFSVSAQVSKAVSLGTALNFGNLTAANVSFQTAFARDTGSLNWGVNTNFLITLIKKEKTYEIFERESFVTGTFSKRFGRWKMIAFADAENSFLRKTLFRFSGGVGGGVDLLNRKGWKIAVSEVIMPEVYIPDDDVRPRLFSLRPSTRLKIKYTGKVIFESIHFFQPSVWTTGNIRFVDNINYRSTHTLDIPVSRIITIGIQSTIQIFTLPAYLDTKVKWYDSRIAFLVKATF